MLCLLVRVGKRVEKNDSNREGYDKSPRQYGYG